MPPADQIGDEFVGNANTKVYTFVCMCGTVRVVPTMPKQRLHDVLPTREARAALPKMLAAFRAAPRAAQAYVIGSRRKPEAVVLSYERYMDMVEQLADREMQTVAERRLAGAEAQPVDLDDVAAKLGFAPEDYRPIG